jgi:hypothetical protein
MDGDRRRKRLIAVAAAAVVITIATIALRLIGVDRVDGVAAPTTAQPRPGPTTAPYRHVPRLVEARPVERLWPEALVTLPARLPDGRAYLLAGILTDRRFLIAPYESGDQPGAELLLWEPDRDSVRTLGDPPTPPGLRTRLGGVPDVGDGYVVWMVQAARGFGRGLYQEIWATPLAGGGARRLAVVDGPAVGSAVHIVKEQVYWAQEPETADVTDGGLYRVPLTGGGATAVPGGRGYALMRTHPWAHTIGDGATSAGLWNLVDGTRTPMTLRDLVRFECSPSWCVKIDRDKGRSVVRRLDGSGGLEVDFRATFLTTANENIVSGILYDANGDADGWAVWDLRTGELGTVAQFRDSDPTTSDVLSMVSWLNPDGTMTVLDPMAIP